MNNFKINHFLELFKAKHVHAIEDHFNNLNEISAAIQTAGLEKSQLIFGKKKPLRNFFYTK